jgi:hypothetical protein
MSIIAAELIAFSVASIPTDDTSTSGGAIDATRRPVFTQFTSNAVVSLISDGTDVRVVTITGRDATGAVVTENVTLTNAVEVLSVNTYERIQSVNVASSSGTRTITVKQGAGGSTVTTIPINEVGFHMMFQNAASAAGTQVRHEKMFWKNTNSTLTLTTSTMTLTVDASTKINIGVETSTGGTTSVANRLAVPANPTFVGVGTAQAIPGGGNLAAAATIGVWVRQSLASNDAAQKNSFTTQLAGNTV